MKKICTSILLLCILSAGSSAQTPFFRNITLLKKNDPVNVNVVFQDHTGFIWCGTNKGLFKYDGIRQKRFTTADSLPDNNVSAIGQDKEGRIWTGHKNGMLAFIEYGTVKKFNPREGSAAAEISDIIFDQNNVMWFSTLGDGLYYYQKERLYRLDEAEHLPDLFIYDLAEDNKGNIWAGTDGGAAICSNKSGISINTINYENGLPDNIIRKILVDGNNAWMGTEDAGIICYDLTTHKSRTLLKENWQYGPVTDFLFKDNKLWVSSYQKGLLVIDTASTEVSLYNASSNQGFAAISCVLKDREENVWLGTAAGITLTPGDYVKYIEGFGASVAHNVIALTTDKKGAVWFSNGDGLYKHETGQAVQKQLGKTPFEKFSVISLYTDKDGYIWAGLYGQGILRINAETNKILWIQKELKDGNVLNITGTASHVWLATLGGATSIDITGDSPVIRNYDRNAGLASEYIYQVFADSRNRMWFATDGKGINMLDEKGFHHFNEGLNTKVIYGLAECNGAIWANIQGEGLYKFNGKEFRQVQQGIIHNNNITSFTSDASGNLVLMNDFGIEVYNPATNTSFNLGEQSGLHDKKGNLNALSKDPKGNIYIGSDGGVIIYSGKTPQRQGPKPVIESLKVLDKSIETGNNLSFNYNENSITINYLSIWYQNTENVNFQYKLENYDKDWIDSRNHFAVYSSLPPGEYIFRLRTSDSGSFKNAEETSFSFNIHPPFWQTTWFYILSICSVIAITFAIIKYREKNLKQGQKILEAKNAELKKINMELDRFVYSVSHDLRAPLLSMQGVIDITEEETAEEITAEHMKMLTESINRLDAFIGEILDYSQNARSEVKVEVIDFRQMLSEISANLQFMNGANTSVRINTDVKGNSTIYSDKGRLSVVLNNLISNAIKYHNPKADTPFVNINVDLNNDRAFVEIEDNGIGISEEFHQKVFEMFYRVSETSTGSGLGLYIVKEAVHKLHGDIRIESKPGRGTKFSFSIPNLFYQ